MPPLDEDRCYAAAASRDARFDGHFVTAVKTTGIYCRPSCPAITPRRVNVEFHPTAAAAQQRGFRACKRCLPDATPGSPEWNMRRDVVARAMRLIADGEVERSGVAGLATRLGYSARHLNRLLTDDVGAGPLAIARAQRAHTARVLIETTTMRLTDVAFAAGFGSIRQFNDTIREVYAASPSALRTAAGRRSARTVAGPPDAPGSTGASTRLRLRLPYRGPLAAVGLFDWFAARAIDGIERVERVGQGAVERRIHERVVRTPAGHAVTSTEIAGTDAPEITADVRLVDPTDLAAVVQRLRRMYDLDADPIAIDERLVCDPMLAPLIARRPGLRSPGSTDAFETAVRAVIGQQISVSAARTVADRLVTSVGEPIESSERHVGGPTFVFPTAEQLVEAPDEALAMPSARARTIRSLAGAVADGRLVLDAGADAVDTRAALLELPGIGPWTADYIVLRGLSHPDVDLSTDLIVARTAE
ncbi:MAG: Ada metal-binding domain-containing protein, partial [Actinomycetota bacterium]